MRALAPYFSNRKHQFKIETGKLQVSRNPRTRTALENQSMNFGSYSKEI